VDVVHTCRPTWGRSGFWSTFFAFCLEEKWSAPTGLPRTSPLSGLHFLQSGLEEFITSLRDHGLAEPILGFTDNVASDAGTFLECIPSFNKDVESVSIYKFSDLPQLILPEGVSVISCNTEAEISSACLAIIDRIDSNLYWL